MINVAFSLKQTAIYSGRDNHEEKFYSHCPKKECSNIKTR
jgi:hypothetical protein